MPVSRRQVLLGAMAGTAGLVAGCARPDPVEPPLGRLALRGVASKTVVIPLPDEGFDPTEVSVPWLQLTAHGVTIVFATPSGQIGAADPRMLSGEGLGRYAERMRANAVAREAHAQMRQSPDFRNPRAYGALQAADYDALLLPGGHAPETKVYLESPTLQAFVAEFFASGRPVGAICHGVLLAARSRLPGAERSVLWGKKTTALPRHMERLAWKLTRRRLGDYYRTYPTYVQDEVTAALKDPDDFIVGPRGYERDSPEDLAPGFVVVDGSYVSARWPGDAHRFAHAMLRQLAAA